MGQVDCPRAPGISGPTKARLGIQASSPLSPPPAPASIHSFPFVAERADKLSLRAETYPPPPLPPLKIQVQLSLLVKPISLRESLEGSSGGGDLHIWVPASEPCFPTCKLRLVIIPTSLLVFSLVEQKRAWRDWALSAINYSVN